MRAAAVVVATALSAVLGLAAGCGSAPTRAAHGLDADGPGTAGSASATAPGSGGSAAASTVCEGGEPAQLTVDLTGDGVGTLLTFERYTNCSPVFGTAEGPRSFSAPVDDLPLARHGLRALSVPGRTGQLVLLVQVSPRGGFQAHLFGYADGRFGEVTAAGAPVLPFVATDTGDQHLAASCRRGGIDVVSAARGLRGWRVERVGYRLSGNVATRSGATVLAAHLSHHELARRFADVVADTLFAGCG